MAAATKQDREVLQSVVPAALADRVRELAKEERRTVSNTIRVTLEDRLRDRQP